MCVPHRLHFFLFFDFFQTTEKKLSLTMKAKTLQVVWHSKQPVFSLDFHPSGLLATGGGDKDVKVNRERLF